MPVIEVKKTFGLRLSRKTDARQFSPGLHTVSEEELAHWLLRECLRTGRAVLVPEAEAPGNALAGEQDAAGGGNPPQEESLTAPTREDLLKMKNSELEELLVACGVTMVLNTKKADLVDMLLAGHEGVSIVMGPDGIYVQTGDSVPQAPLGSSQAKPDDAPVQKAE